MSNNASALVETFLDKRREAHYGYPARIRNAYDSLSPAERRVADYVLQFPDSVMSLTARDLGKLADTSEATVVRFCQALGYKGLPELRTDLMQEAFAAKRQDYQGVTPQDGASELIRKVAYKSIEALQQTINTLDATEFQRAVLAIQQAKVTWFFGSGGSAHVAQEAALKLLRMGRRAAAYSDYFSQVIGASLLTTDDVAIGLSYTGATRDTIEFLQAAKQAEATTIVITNFARSPITETSDICLVTGAQPGIMGGEAGSSRVTQLMVLDAIATALAVNWPHNSESTTNSK